MVADSSLTRGPFDDVVDADDEEHEKVEVAAVVEVGDGGHDRQQETRLAMVLSRVYAVDPVCWHAALSTLGGVDQQANDL